MNAHHLTIWAWLVCTATLPGAAPRVVETTPVQGAVDVPAGEAEIVVTFDAAIKQNSWSIVAADEGAMPELLDDGPPVFRDDRTCVIKVRLAPGTKYAIGLNSATRKGFKAAEDGTGAEPYTLVFTTASAPSAAGKTSAPKTDRQADRAGKPITVRCDYRKGDRGQMSQRTSFELRIQTSSGQEQKLATRRSIDGIDEVTAIEGGLPVGVRRRVTKYSVQATNPLTGAQSAASELDGPVTVQLDRSTSPTGVEVLDGDAPDELLSLLADDAFLDFAPSGSIEVGRTYAPPEATLDKIREAFGTSDKLNLALKCRRIGPADVATGLDSGSPPRKGSARLRMNVVEFDLDWKQSGKLESSLPFTLSGKGEVVYALEAGILLRLSARGEIKLDSVRLPDANGQPVTVSGGGKYTTEYTFAPIAWKRGLIAPPAEAAADKGRDAPNATSPADAPSPQKQASPKPVDGQAPDRAVPKTDKTSAASGRDAPGQAAPEPPAERSPKAKPAGLASGRAVPKDWAVIDDDLFGTQVAVPPGWTPRVRGDVAYCIEPDEVARAGAFFVPMLLKGRAAPEEVADGFDAMLQRGLPDLKSATSGKPAGECVQRAFTATLSGEAVAGEYRAVVGRAGTAMVMGYLAPRERLESLKPSFHTILGSYRYSGPRTRMQPFKSAAIELRIPAGWQVQTSEANGTANQDIDWQATLSSAPGVRAFMVSPKFFTPNWIADVMTGQVDPQLLALWRNRGFQPAGFTSNEQALEAAIGSALPGLEVVRKQSLDEVRDLFARMMQAAIAGSQMAGGDLQLSVVEYVGYRQVQGVRMKCVATVGMGTILAQGSFNRSLAVWMTGIRGFEAPVERFAQFAPALERITGSFSYTEWWIREVMKANDEQARTLRKFYADMNRMDKEIFDSHVQTRSAISEMMYDTLTENHGYVNEKTNTVEKIPDDKLDAFRNASGDVVSAEDVIDRHIPVQDATRLRMAGADDYMAFDRRVQVWP